MKVIYLGAEGFWVTEAVFQVVKGVIAATPGYMGGDVPNPSQELVATGTTGHAEVVEISYDETVVSTEDLLNIFFAFHDPSAANYPARGVGSAYRSVIFYTDPVEAEDIIAETQSSGLGAAVGVIPRAIQKIQDRLPEDTVVAVDVGTAVEFYPADETQYNYYIQHSDDAYSTSVIAPKVAMARAHYPELFS